MCVGRGSHISTLSHNIRDDGMSPSRLLKFNFSYLLKELQLTRYAAFFFSDIIDKNPEITNCPKEERKHSESLPFSMSLSLPSSKYRIKLWIFYKVNLSGFPWAHYFLILIPYGVLHKVNVLMNQVRVLLKCRLLFIGPGRGLRFFLCSSRLPDWY